ncbi:hypothetical protein RMR21_015550 [Agrobacterium sp. rho-8.1]|nr:hypothetical protein [Agrobacterium sp. rho-8.1]
MDNLFDKAIAAALKMIDFVNLSETIVFIIVVAVLRILHLLAAGWVMKHCGLQRFKTLGMTLEAPPAIKLKKSVDLVRPSREDEAA